MKLQKIPKMKIAVFLIVLLIGFFLIPTLSFAAIVPTTCDGPDCGFDNLLELAKNLMNFLITVSIPLAAIAFAYAGYLFMTAGGSESQVSKAKGIFTKVLIGFIFVLGAWLIVWTITSALLCNSSSATCGFYNLLGR